MPSEHWKGGYMKQSLDDLKVAYRTVLCLLPEPVSVEEHRLLLLIAAAVVEQEPGSPLWKRMHGYHSKHSKSRKVVGNGREGAST